MSDRSDIWIRSRKTGELVPAVLIDGLEKAVVKNANSEWLAVVQQAIDDVKAGKRSATGFPNHYHWDWEKKFDLIDGILAYQLIGVECDGAIQGMMIIQTSAVYSRSPDAKGKGLVYIKYLASAPWNLSALVAAPKYKEVGAVLLSAAIQASNELGFEGRIGLHSLTQSCTWYSENGMDDFGKDPREENLHYFEMSMANAKKFIS